MLTENITYRACEERDIEYLLWLRKETMNTHLENSGLSIDDENHIKRIRYRFENAKFIYLNEKKIGLLKILQEQEHIEIIQIQIEPDYQGKGLGEILIKKIIDTNSRKMPIRLNVLKENKARKLYEKLGFKIIEEDQHSFMMEC